ncbi:MAG TPA: sortase [Clostridiaceae bacterium]|jgi:LPXTG-site transpeptidase (sortase) family protein|nr:sortase [Clostridium sp.]MEE0127402.1 sortase [Clostridia bacterium]HJJ12618.1 sortase [Clostridiaceae bacterium]
MSTAEETYKKILNVFFIILLIALLCIAGYIAYKFISAKIINDDSEEYIAEFENEIGELEEDIINDETVENAENQGENTKKNKAKTVNNARKSKSKKSVKKYYNYDICGYIRIPKTGIKYPIISTLSKQALEKGVCVEYGPGPNEPGNTVIAGHNYLNRLFFSKNKNLNIGDKVYITDLYGVTVEYTIYNKFETSPQDTNYMFRDTGGAPEITLATCSQNGSARLILYAK